MTIYFKRALSLVWSSRSSVRDSLRRMGTAPADLSTGYSTINVCFAFCFPSLGRAAASVFLWVDAKTFLLALARGLFSYFYYNWLTCFWSFSTSFWALRKSNWVFLRCVSIMPLTLCLPSTSLRMVVTVSWCWSLPPTLLVSGLTRGLGSHFFSLYVICSSLFFSFNSSTFFCKSLHFFSNSYYSAIALFFSCYDLRTSFVWLSFESRRARKARRRNLISFLLLDFMSPSPGIWCMASRYLIASISSSMLSSSSSIRSSP